jgi:glutathione peroxidase
MATVYDFSAKLNNGNEKSLGDYRGKVLLIVNTASRCGNTPQYEELQKLYDKYSGQGLEILAFPCNQFGRQEPGTDEDIRSFCETNYHVSFPLFSKIEVNGGGTHPLYKYLKSEAGGLVTDAIKWNFTKFLVGRDGAVLERIAPFVKPSEIEQEIASVLQS